MRIEAINSLAFSGSGGWWAESAHHPPDPEKAKYSMKEDGPMLDIDVVVSNAHNTIFLEIDFITGMDRLDHSG